MNENQTLKRSLILESFRLEYEYEFKHEYDFPISNQSRSQNCHFSQLLISEGEGFRNNVAVLSGVLEYGLSVRKVVLVLILVLIVQSKVPY